MKSIWRNFFEGSGILLFIFISLVNFFWYSLIGEDTELNTSSTYIYYICFYVGFSLWLFLFLTYGKTKMSKIIAAFAGVITMPLWIAGYLGAANVMIPESELVNTRLLVLITQGITIIYALFQLFRRNHYNGYVVKEK